MALIAAWWFHAWSKSTHAAVVVRESDTKAIRVRRGRDNVIGQPKNQAEKSEIQHRNLTYARQARWAAKAKILRQCGTNGDCITWMGRDDDSTPRAL